MDVLLDPQWASALAIGEDDSEWDALQAHCLESGSRIWLYVGALSDMLKGAAGTLQEQGHDAPEKAARDMLRAFAKDKQWLSALSGEGQVLESEHPLRAQLLRAVARFDGTCVIITKDASFLQADGDRVMSPQAYCATPAKHAIPFINLGLQQDKIRGDLERRLHRVMHHGAYINGPEVGLLETMLAQYVGVEHCIGVSSGTDALLVAMMALGIGVGDEVITTPFTFIATGEMIAFLGAKPVFVDIDPKTYNLDPSRIEAAITPKTKAIVPVSLYGQCADMDAINAVACKHELPVIEDGAQSFGAVYKNRMSCGLSLIGATSFFPSKPLGGYGDGGAIFTNDVDLAKAMREIREHGQDRRYHHPRVGLNGRLDSLQAAVLLAKVPVFDQERCDRVGVANRYKRALANLDGVTVPYVHPENTSVYAQYTLQVRDRDAFMEKMKSKGIPLAVHYPVPLHLQPVFADGGQGKGAFPVAEEVSGHVVSLPMHPYMTEEEQDRIIEAVKGSV